MRKIFSIISYYIIHYICQTFFVTGCHGGSTRQIANILFWSSFLPIVKRIISKWPYFSLPPPVAYNSSPSKKLIKIAYLYNFFVTEYSRLTMIPYCLYMRKLCTCSGPRIYFNRFCILGGRNPAGNCGTLSITLSLDRSGYSISENFIYKHNI